MVIDFDNRIVVKGQGNPVVLIHGISGPKVWESIVDELAKKYKVIIPTFPGYLVEDGIIEYSDKLYVEFLEKVRIHLNIEKWNVIGFSMGGRTVINYALDYKQYISKMIIISSAGVGYVSPLIRVYILKTILPKLLYHIFSHPNIFKKLVSKEFVDIKSESFKNFTKQFAEIMSADTVRLNFSNILPQISMPKYKWKNNLKSIHVSTMILWGKEDTIVPVKWAYQLNRLIPNSKLYILNKYKHMAIMERSMFFSNLIIEFLIDSSHEGVT